jgi:transcriptional regulator with XRE-family HTH domain
MKISEKIKRLFRREPPTAEELAARAGADAASAQRSIERGNADIATRTDRFNPPPGF